MRCIYETARITSKPLLQALTVAGIGDRGRGGTYAEIIMPAAIRDLAAAI